MTGSIFRLGAKIYNLNDRKEKRRWIVFVLRTIRYYPGVKELYEWFQQDPMRQRILEKYPFPIEQAERKFFYAGATFRERSELIKNHLQVMQDRVQPEVAETLACAEGSFPIWQAGDEGPAWTVRLLNAPGNRKEGMLTLVMQYGDFILYQMMFWLGRSKAGEDALWIGAMQGPNTEDALERIRETTKRAFTYRTKNLILYLMMAFARAMGAKRIYAVSYRGYYAFARRDHKIKTDLDSFWQEAGGHLTDDPRFYEIPLTSPRKPIEEVPSKKRAAYRRRFAFLDDADAQVAENAGRLLKAPSV